MYCKHCGKEIDDNSSFCKHCGKSQDSNSKPFIFQPVWIIYLIWALSNMCLLLDKKHPEASEYFYPFTEYWHYSNHWGNWSRIFYDFSEFIVYVFVLPAIIYFIYRIFKNPIDKAINKILNKQQK